MRTITFSGKDTTFVGTESAHEVLQRTEGNIWLDEARSKEASEEYKTRRADGPAFEIVKKEAFLRTRKHKQSFDLMRWKCHLCPFETDIRKNDTPNKVYSRKMAHIRKAHLTAHARGDFRETKCT